MPQQYAEAIIKYLAGRGYQPLKPRQLARQMGIEDAEYGAFRTAIKTLRDSGRVALGAKDSLTLPEMPGKVVGFYRPNQRGFGFIIPETPNAHGDLFIPEGAAGGALNGDLVVATVRKQGKREGRMLFAGQIVEIVKRARNQFVGTLQRTEGTWFVLPDGSGMTTPIVVADVGTAGPGEGAKVVAEIIKYPSPGELPEGVLVEVLGPSGQIEVETRAVIRAHGLEEAFSDAAMDDARRAAEGFDPQALDGRRDLTGWTIVTIDPPDARDFDDAISLTRHGQEVTLGVHIADVSHFVREGTALNEVARLRGTSVYFPRKVVPMLPEVLSNGVCSLQEGKNRYCKSVFITYDAQAGIVRTEYAETVIRSTKRLTYAQAQDICDGKVGGYPREVVELIHGCLDLARLIEHRRRQAGMLHLDLPEVRLIIDDAGKVTDAEPEDDAYTHTMIEMFMVEANEAVADLMERLNRPCLRRVHPAPEAASSAPLSAFLRAAGHRLPASFSRRELQDLLAAVRGKPESYTVNLAVLKTFQQAEYSPMRIGHFALASEHYCHFTSPIRRYPDLTVHRLLADYCRGQMNARTSEDVAELVKLGQHCTAAERRAEAAEEELREVLILQMLENRVGQDFDGVVAGVANFGIFVQLRKLLIEGLVRLEDLGDDWWEVNAKMGQVRGERSGRTIRIGDLMDVRIVGVDLARRQLNLHPSKEQRQAKPTGRKRRGRRS